MKDGNTHVAAEIPVPEAEKLLLDAIRRGMNIQEFIGYHVLRSAFGSMHPVVVAFEAALGGTTFDEMKP